MESLGESPGVAPITPIMDLSVPLSPPDFRAFAQARIAFFADSPSTQLSDRAIGDITSLCLVNSEGRCRDEVETLIDALRDATIGVGPGRSLTNKTELAGTYFAVGDVQATCAVLAGFLNEVEAQRGKKLTHDVADTLITDARNSSQPLDATDGWATCPPHRRLRVSIFHAGSSRCGGNSGRDAVGQAEASGADSVRAVDGRRTAAGRAASSGYDPTSARGVSRIMAFDER